MPSLKEIKTRIASVKSTRKITSAMKMVASSKLHHAQTAIQNMLPYENMLEHILKGFLVSMPDAESVYSLERGEVKKVAGTLKIDMAQYRELESFSKFSSDMDPVTAMTIDRGRKNNQLLIQPQYSPMPVGEQIAILYCGVHGLMHDVEVEMVRSCQDQFLEQMRTKHQDVIDNLASGKLLDEDVKTIEEVMANVTGQFKK